MRSVFVASFPLILSFHVLESPSLQVGLSCSAMTLLSKPILRAGFAPMTRSFATRFYDSPLYRSLQKEYQSVSETEEKGIRCLLLEE